jgi:biotin carboxylase
MTRLLIAGGGHSDVPLIQAARNLGWTVATAGNRPAEPGHRYSHVFLHCDYSDPQAVLAAAQQFQADAVCACCNDFSALSCAFVAAQLQLPGHDTPEICSIIHHKDRWRQFSQQAQLPGPQAVGCTDAAGVKAAVKQLGLPVIVKPVDLTGGKGIQTAHTLEEAIAAAQTALAASRAKRIVVEEFLTGTRHGLTCLLQGQQVVFSFADDEYYHLSPYRVSAASSMTSCTAETLAEVLQAVQHTATQLQLQDGIFHLQFIRRPDGRPAILDVCRRAPGDLYVDLVRHATTVPYAELIVKAAAGLPFQVPQTLPVQRCITRHCLMADQCGILQEIRFAAEIEPRIIDRTIWGQPGESVTDPGLQKFGIVFVDHGNVLQLRSEAPRLQQLLQCRVN